MSCLRSSAYPVRLQDILHAIDNRLFLHHAEWIDKQVLQFSDGFLREGNKNVFTRLEGLPGLANEGIVLSLYVKIAGLQTHVVIVG